MKLNLKIEWWKADDRSEPILVHQEALKETAFGQIAVKLVEGNTQGELFHNLCMLDTDPESGIDYRGHWEASEVIGEVPPLKHYAVIGRIPGDDEDSCFIFETGSREEAIALFEKEIYELDDDADRDDVIEEHGVACFITHVLISDKSILEA